MNRAESLEHGQMVEFFPIRKSNDAAVGELVHILKKAPPLHQNFNTSEHSSILCEGLRRTAIPTNFTTPPLESKFYPLINITKHFQFNIFYFTSMVIINTPLHDTATLVKMLLSLFQLYTFLNTCEITK